jgi:UDP-N-acetylmuramate--alanine ligase
MDLSEYSHIYFVGIGGIGMSALALYFHSAGKSVAGYDRTATDITMGLQAKGIAVHYEDAVALVPPEFKDPGTTLVVYTPAVSETHKELSYFRSGQFELRKRAFILGEITRHTFCFAVAGTHGKTTTTSIIAHLLMECQASFSAFLGGISENYNSNLLLNGTDISVVEADEFDRSFLNLSPNYACVTSMDADHLDIYGSDTAIAESFRAFTECIKPEGKLFVRYGLPLEGITYGIEENADYSAENIRIDQGAYLFDLKTPKGVFENFKFNLPGRHNLSNAVIALAMTVEYGFPQPQLANALASYKGVKRRFTTHIKSEDLVFVDDYAHHPQEIRAVHQALREMYPDERILAIFQPHLFSRTQDFAKEFAEALRAFDEVILLEIYPARERPIEGVSSQWLLSLIQHPDKHLISKADLPRMVQNSAAKVIVTMGAGDIGEEVKTIKNALLSEA